MKIHSLLLTIALIVSNLLYAAAIPQAETQQEQRMRELLPTATELETASQAVLEQIIQSFSYTDLVNLMHSSPILKIRLKPEFDRRN